MDTNDSVVERVWVNRVNFAIFTTSRGTTRNKSNHPQWKGWPVYSSIKCQKFQVVVVHLDLTFTTATACMWANRLAIQQLKLTNRLIRRSFSNWQKSRKWVSQWEEIQRLFSRTRVSQILYFLELCLTQLSFKMATTLKLEKWSFHLRTFEKTKVKFYP